MADQIEEMSLADYEKMMADAPTPVVVKGVDVSDVVVPLGDYSLDQTRLITALQRKRDKNKKPKTAVEGLGEMWDNAVERQGGQFGISPETRKALGGDGPIEALRPITDLPANIANLGVAGMQGLGAVADTGAQLLDKGSEASGLADLLSFDGNKFLPGSAMMALGEAFPVGGAETGLIGHFAAPKNDPLPTEVRARLNTEADALFQSGASVEELQAWAKKNGMSPFEPKDLEAAIAQRPEVNRPVGVSAEELAKTQLQSQGLAAEAQAFKGTPEPKPTDLFPTDASRAADAEAWGQQLLKGKTPSDPISPEGLQHEAQATGESPWKDTTEYETGFDSSRVKNQPIKDVADYIASDSQHEDLKHIASRLSTKISELQDAGMKFDPVKILNAGERGPASVANGSARGLSLWEMKNGEHSLSVHLRGNDLGAGGENFRTTTHELIHSVTQAAIELGNRRIAEGTPLAKAVGDLLDLQNTVTRKFNEDAKAGNFTDFTRGRFNREHNGLSNMHELVAWGLTDRSAQDYLKSIKLDGAQTGFSKFVEVLRKLLGLNPSDDNALSRLISISDDLLKVPGKDVVELGNKFPKSHGGKAAAAQEAGGISKKDADTQFNEAFSTPKKPLTTKEFARRLEKDATAFLDRKQADETATAVAEEPAAPAVDDLNTGLPENVPETAPQESVITRLTAALNNAGKASKKQTALYKEERAKRFAQVADAQAAGGGRAAYEKSLAAMKGELPKADFESVESQFTPAEITGLFDTVSESTLSSGSKLSAHSGLEKLLKGERVQPRELENLAGVFPPDFIKAALSNRSKMAKAGSLLGDIWNAPKSLQSTADLSGPLRQGIGLIHRAEFWKSLGPMVKAAFSPKYSAELEAKIRSHPNYDLATESGLSVTSAGKLGTHEDIFRSHLAERIPVWGKVVQGSEQAYVGFLNKLRFDTFNTMLGQASSLGHDLKDPTVAKGIARYINVMTGRGGLGAFEPASNALNNVIYSPGLISSRLQILTAPAASAGGKGFIADLPKGMRKEAAKSYAAIIGFNTTALSLAVMAGKDVNLDPRSSDFLKLKDGDTRLDFGGGLQQYIVAGTRAILRKSTASGENGGTRDLTRQGDTPLDNDIKFVVNKLHPSLTLFLDQQRGKTTVGEPFEWQTAVIDRLTPMGVPDIVATLKEHKGNPGVFYGVLGILGAGLSNYHSKGDDVPEGATEFGPTEDVSNDSVGEMSLEEYEALMSNQGVSQ